MGIVMKNIFALCLISVSLLACTNGKNDKTVSNQENATVVKEETVGSQETTTALNEKEQTELENLLTELSDAGFDNHSKYNELARSERLHTLLKKSCDTGNKEHCRTHLLLESMPEWEELAKKVHQDGDMSQLPKLMEITEKMCYDDSGVHCLGAAEYYLKGFQDKDGNELIQKDTAKAIPLLEKACYPEFDISSVADACQTLSDIYQNGDGVPKDLAKAEELRQKAQQGLEYWKAP